MNEDVYIIIIINVVVVAAAVNDGRVCTVHRTRVRRSTGMYTYLYWAVLYCTGTHVCTGMTLSILTPTRSGCCSTQRRRRKRR